MMPGFQPRSFRSLTKAMVTGVFPVPPALQDAGYATDPHYARKLTNMIQQMKSISDKVSKTYSMNIDNLF